jgi:hypothetical protein
VALELLPDQEFLGDVDLLVERVTRQAQNLHNSQQNFSRNSQQTPTSEQGVAERCISGG